MTEGSAAGMEWSRMMSRKARRAAEVEPRAGSNYPDPFRARVQGRRKRALGDLFGLDQFGVNLTELPPGALSALRHWHSHEDEFVYILEGEAPSSPMRAMRYSGRATASASRPASPTVTTSSTAGNTWRATSRSAPAVSTWTASLTRTTIWRRAPTAAAAAA
jgi:hypothetical protein